MKPQALLLVLTLMFSANVFSAESNQKDRMFIPYLDTASQSNVVVAVCDADQGQPCPVQYTNVLSNTNLFTPKEQQLLTEVFEKYKNVTTNSGPKGTILVDLNKTSYTTNAMNRTFEVEKWVAHFAYRNLDAKEEIVFNKGGGIFAKFRTKLNDGYNVTFARTGSGMMLQFTEIKGDLSNGIIAAFEDNSLKGTNWNFRSMNFTNSHLTQYRQYTNGMVLGKFFTWNFQNGNLLIQAEFKEPYDWKKHIISGAMTR